MTIAIDAARLESAVANAPLPGWLSGQARITGIGTAVPATPFSQQDVLDAFKVTDPKMRSIFLNSGIERRFLSLPPAGADGVPVPESQGDLLDKHKQQAVDM